MGARAQMWNGVDTLYGNEWIDYAKPYFKIKIAADGMYKLDFAAFNQAGFPIAAIPAQQFRLLRYGQQVPVFTTTDGVFGNQDYLAFYGEKNRGQVDYYLFENADQEQINPEYSLFNDTTVYYLTWETSGQPLRYTTLPNDLTNLPPREPFCWSTVEQVFTNGLFKKKLSDEVTYSWFDGVGFTTSGSASENPVPIVLPGFVNNAPDARMHVRYACNLGQHQKKILLNDSLYAEDQFSEYKLIDHVFSVPANRLTATTTLKITSPIGDRHGLAVASIRYARVFDFGGSASVRFELNASASDQYLEIQSFNSGSGPPELYDLTHRMRLVCTVEGGLVKVKLPASAEERKFLLVSPEALIPVQNLQSIQFVNPDTGPADYLIVSNAALFSDPLAGGANRVAEYAAYRTSSAGGNHSVKVVDVEDLYEQFAYGVRFHPIAIRNFLHWAKKRWPALDHAFIIGKALDFQSFRTALQQSTLADSLFFVPNFSTPGSDMPFVMQGNRLTDPIMAIGRLAVTKPHEIHDYLQKVVQQEQALANAEQSIAGKAWMKRVIHNSGGLSAETSAIRNYTTSMANTLTTNRFGADVHSFYKTSDDPIQLSAYEQLLDLVNEGVAVWTIFGHSSAFAIDFDIGLPDSYDNYGRYPLLMVMGCFSGICSSPQQGIGEQFVLAPNRGAIAYIASVNYSYINALHDYGNQYYQRMGGADYGNTVGLTLAHTISDLKQTPDNGLIAILHQNLLQGDPAIRMYAHEGPDYLVDQQSVRFDPNPVNVNDAQVKMSFDVINIGENTGNQLAIKVDQRLPDNTTTLARLLDTLPAPAFR